MYQHKSLRLADMDSKPAMQLLFLLPGSLTQDGRDRSRDYKLSGFHCPLGSWDAQMLSCYFLGKGGAQLLGSLQAVLTGLEDPKDDAGH
eukprot:74318-Pelagomonas_calceolata.AAC.1